MSKKKRTKQRTEPREQQANHSLVMLKKKFQSEGKKKEDDAWLDAEECRLLFKFRTGDGAKLSKNTSFFGFGHKSQTSEQAKTDSKAGKIEMYRGKQPIIS